MQQVLKKRGALDEIQAQRNALEEQKAVIRREVKQMVIDNEHIDSARTVQQRVLQNAQQKDSVARIRRMMSKDLDMSYARIKNISLRGNSVNNLIMRQRFAIKMLSLTQKKTIFINMDETWLDQSDYRRMKWRPKHSTNSMPIVQLAPRISMLVALDTLGNVYLSLTQSNSNNQIMEIFFR